MIDIKSKLNTLINTFKKTKEKTYTIDEVKAFSENAVNIYKTQQEYFSPKEKTYTFYEMETIASLFHSVGVNDGMEGVPQSFHDKATIHPHYGNLSHIEWFTEKWSEHRDEAFSNLSQTLEKLKR